MKGPVSLFAGGRTVSTRHNVPTDDFISTRANFLCHRRKHPDERCTECIGMTPIILAIYIFIHYIHIITTIRRLNHKSLPPLPSPLTSSTQKRSLSLPICLSQSTVSLMARQAKLYPVIRCDAISVRPRRLDSRRLHTCSDDDRLEPSQSSAVSAPVAAGPRMEYSRWNDNALAATSSSSDGPGRPSAPLTNGRKAGRGKRGIEERCVLR